MESFNDSLEARRFAERWRGIGHPADFLQRVGINPIKEAMAHGKTLIGVAEALNVPVIVLVAWIKENNHTEEINEAGRLSAEGYLWRGEKMLAEATNAKELQKAKLMIDRGEFMAKKKDKNQYGDAVKIDATVAAVSYNFVIPQAPVEKPALKASFTDVTEPIVEDPKITLRLPTKSAPITTLSIYEPEPVDIPLDDLDE